MAEPSARRKKPVNAAYLKKAPNDGHVGLAAYITATTGEEMDAATVALVQRLYPLYLKSPAVVKAREAAEAAKAEEKARKEREKRERAQARLDRIEEQRRKLLAELGIEDEGGKVIDASTRFVDKGIVFGDDAEDAEDSEEPEEVEAVVEPDEEPETVEATLEDDEDWEEDEDEEDF